MKGHRFMRDHILAHRSCAAGLFVTFVLASAGGVAGSARAAQPPVGLGTAESFAVLAGPSVSNTGPSVINGDLGVSPGTAVTGFPPGTINGTKHVADALAAQAKRDLITAYDDAAGRTPAASVSGDLGGQTLTPGVYRSTSSLGLTGTLTLDAQGDPNAVFIFQVGSTLITASGSRVNLIGGAQACNVFWQVGSSATLGTNSTFKGNILALTAASLNTGAIVDGRVLARNAGVTLDTNTITRAQCAAGTTAGPAPGGSDTTGTGGPGSTTTAPKPAAATGPASHIGPDRVLLNATINPGGVSTTYYFQYGTTKHYGHRTPTRHAGSGTRAFSVHARVLRLRPRTRYHYRIVAVGPTGKRTYGTDRTFRTTSTRTARHRVTRQPRFTG
jgi:hypothetical protein